VVIKTLMPRRIGPRREVLAILGSSSCKRGFRSAEKVPSK